MIKPFTSFAMLVIAVVATAAAALADPYADVEKMGVAYSHATSYRANIQTKQGAMNMEFSAPSKWHMQMGSTMEAIMIGSDAWYKVNGSWMHVSAAMAGMGPQKAISQAQNYVPQGNFKDDYDVTDLGMKDGYHAYDLRKKGASDHSVIYLRPDSLPAKIEATHGSQTSTITYTDWNTPITISPPQ